MSSSSSSNLTNFQKVRDFNISFGCNRSKTPDDKLFKLRWDLIEEESQELFDSLNDRNYVEIIDAVSDILYVVLGASDAFDFDLDTKLNPNDIKELIENPKWTLKNIKQVNDIPFSKARMEFIFNNTETANILVKLVMSYKDELEKLKQLFNTKNTEDIINQLVIIHNYLYLWAYLFGFNLDETFDLVHQSNMSKLAETEDIAKETVKWYLENEKRYDSPAYRLSTIKVNGQPRWVIYNQNTGKALKSINYFPVNLHNYL
jgi:predicted HAD superfamily Cof-like phosphohydrolase